MDNSLGVRTVNPSYADWSSNNWINNQNAYWMQQQQMQYDMYQQEREDSFATKGALGGAAAGAAIGAVVGFGVPGAIVGGIVGGIAGLFGGKLFAKM